MLTVRRFATTGITTTIRMSARRMATTAPTGSQAVCSWALAPGMVAAGATGAALATVAVATVAVATVTGGLDTATAVGPDMARGPVMRVEPMVVERGLDMVAAAHGLPAATVAAERTTVVVVVTSAVVVVVTSAVVVVAVTQWVVAADMVAAVTGKLFA